MIFVGVCTQANILNMGLHLSPSVNEFLVQVGVFEACTTPPPCIVSGRARQFPRTPEGTYPKMPQVTVPSHPHLLCKGRARRHRTHRKKNRMNNK